MDNTFCRYSLKSFTPSCVRSALEHFKRWLVPEKVAISAEELEYLLRPSQKEEAAQQSQTPNDEDAEGDGHNLEEEDALSPEK